MPIPTNGIGIPYYLFHLPKHCGRQDIQGSIALHALATTQTDLPKKQGKIVLKEEYPECVAVCNASVRASLFRLFPFGYASID